MSNHYLLPIPSLPPLLAHLGARARALSLPLMIHSLSCSLEKISLTVSLFCLQGEIQTLGRGLYSGLLNLPSMASSFLALISTPKTWLTPGPSLSDPIVRSPFLGTVSLDCVPQKGRACCLHPILSLSHQALNSGGTQPCPRGKCRRTNVGKSDTPRVLFRAPSHCHVLS